MKLFIRRLNVKNYLGITALMAFGLFAQVATADIASPALLNCTVTSVTPVGAQFFGFGGGPKVGDTTELDLDQEEFSNINFSSGVVIGPTVNKHYLKRAPGMWQGLSLYEVKFTSKHNRQDYHARLVAQDGKDETAKVTLDVVETRSFGRLVMNSLELDCKR